MLQDLRATLVQNHVRVIDLFRDWDEDESGRIDRTEAHLREAARAEVADAGFSPTITARARKLKPPEKVEDRNMRW